MAQLGFDCFRQLFISVNTTASNFIIDNETAFTVREGKSIIGLESLWTIIMDVSNAVISDAAIGLLRACF
jgi:hypothetical protein